MHREIGEMHKGAVFLAEVKRRLFLEGLTVAIPEPDLGDDLWVADIGVSDPEANGTAGNTEAIEPKLLRCQVKSRQTDGVEGGDDKYTVNFTKSSRDRFEHEFFYIIGLSDPRIANEYHVACLPSKYVGMLVKQGRVRFIEKRPALDFFLSPTDGYPKYTLRLQYDPKPGKERGRGNRADVVKFFLTKESTFREAFKHCAAWDGDVKFAPDRNRRGVAEVNPRS